MMGMKASGGCQPTGFLLLVSQVQGAMPSRSEAESGHVVPTTDANEPGATCP